MLIEIRGVVIDLIRIGYIGFKGVFFFIRVFVDLNFLVLLFFVRVNNCCLS